MKTRLLLITLATVVAGVLSLRAAPQLVTAAGATPESIQPEVDGFRARLGPDRGTAPGPFATGFRDINWDSVPDSVSQPNSLPETFFNSTAPRGIVFATAGFGLTVSASRQFIQHRPTLLGR